MFSNNKQVIQAQAAAAIPAFSIIGNGTSDGFAAAAVAATASFHGIGPEYAVAALEMFPIVIGGVAQVKAEGTITKDDLLTCGTTGGAITLVNSGTVHVHSIGKALRAAAANDIFPILVRPQDTLV